MRGATSRVLAWSVAPCLIATVAGCSEPDDSVSAGRSVAATIQTDPPVVTTSTTPSTPQTTIILSTTSTTAPSTTEAVTTTTRPVTPTLPTTIAPSTTIVSDAELAFAYFDAFAEKNRTGFDLMRDLAAPGSGAFAYFYHQERIFIADLQAGGSTAPPGFAKIEGESIIICDDAACTLDTRYGDFEFVDGLLADFTVEGNYISDMVIGEHGADDPTTCWLTADAPADAPCDSPQAISITIRSNYRTAAGDLMITFDWIRGVDAPGEIENDSILVNGEYVPTTSITIDGIEIRCDAWATPFPQPGQFTVGYFRFPAPPVGLGDLSINMRWDGELTDFGFTEVPV